MFSSTHRLVLPTFRAVVTDLGEPSAAVLARVLALGDFGCANAPSWRETAAELIAQRLG